MTVTKHRTCANCGSRAVPIVHGLAMPSAFEAEERGEIALGGCGIFLGESPAWKCSNASCGLEFGVYRDA